MRTQIQAIIEFADVIMITDAYNHKTATLNRIDFKLLSEKYLNELFPLNYKGTRKQIKLLETSVLDFTKENQISFVIIKSF